MITEIDWDEAVTGFLKPVWVLVSELNGAFNSNGSGVISAPTARLLVIGFSWRREGSTFRAEMGRVVGPALEVKAFVECFSNPMSRRQFTVALEGEPITVFRLDNVVLTSVQSMVPSGDFVLADSLTFIVGIIETQPPG